MKIMTDYPEEFDFLLEHCKGKRVLEWGSGGSTHAIAKVAKALTSIEHDLSWYRKVGEELSGSCTYIYVPRNSEEAQGHDGTFEQYESYIEKPAEIISITNKLYDVIFIDGRARVDCAKYAAMYYLKEDGLIFIHDMYDPDEKCRRYEYEVVEEFLTLQESVRCMSKFKVK